MGEWATGRNVVASRKSLVTSQRQPASAALMMSDLPTCDLGF